MMSTNETSIGSNAEYEAAPLSADGSPNWSRIEFDVLCCRCEYNLRMLRQPRCPECGLEFDWPTMLNRALCTSDFLIEHHWRKQPIKSFLKTIWISMRPSRFWSQVSMHEEIHPGPLLAMLILSPLLYVAAHVCSFGLAFLLAIAMGGDASVASSRYVVRESVTAWDTLAWAWGDYINPIIHLRAHWGELISEYILLWLCLAFLCSLRQTMLRRRIRCAHLLRIIAYSSPAIFTYLGIIASITLVTTSIIGTVYGIRQPDWAAAIPLLIAVGLTANHLSAGLKIYANIQRSATIAWTAVLTVSLLLTTAWIILATLAMS